MYTFLWLKHKRRAYEWFFGRHPWRSTVTLRMPLMKWNMPTTRNAVRIAHCLWQRKRNGTYNRAHLLTIHSKWGELLKDTIFHQAGNPFRLNPRYGNERFDSNLDRVHLEIFGNVVIRNASHWNNISMHFMHGFSQCLIPYNYHGIFRSHWSVSTHFQSIWSLSPGNQDKNPVEINIISCKGQRWVRPK